MNTLQTLLAAARRARPGRPFRPVNLASLWAKDRFRHSMFGESGIHEAVRLFGVGR